jgi:hypothetical protein
MELTLPRLELLQQAVELVATTTSYFQEIVAVQVVVRVVMELVILAPYLLEQLEALALSGKEIMVETAQSMAAVVVVVQVLLGSKETKAEHATTAVEMVETVQPHLYLVHL